MVGTIITYLNTKAFANLPTEAKSGALPLENAPAKLLALREKSGWALQPARAEDHTELLKEWIRCDPDHYGRVCATAWLKPMMAVTNLLAVDREGPLLFLRLTNKLRKCNGAGKIWLIDIQFAPVSPLRIARGLASGLPWLAEHARNLGYDALVYESRVPRLVKFMQRAGFRQCVDKEGEHVYTL